MTTSGSQASPGRKWDGHANVIEVRDLVKRYDKRAAVAWLSFDVRAGEVFSILGPNGAGKTTTVEILECIREPTSGKVRILGMDPLTHERAIKERIGVIPQAFTCYDFLTVEENIAYFADLYPRRLPIDELLAAVHLTDRRGERFKGLSGGLKQRVGIAVAIANDPDLVFLDEPTTGLDPKARRDVWEVIRGLSARGKTVILTTHYMDEAEALSDRVAIMDGGRFIAEGSPSEVIRDHGAASTCTVREPSEEAREALAALALPAEARNGDLVITARNRADVAAVFRALEASGAEYAEIQVKRPTLEDVFLKLTGRGLNDAAEVGA